MQFTQFRQIPGAIGSLVPEGIRKYPLFQMLMPLMEDLLINDVRKVIYDKFDGYWDPFATPDPITLGQTVLGLSPEAIKEMFSVGGVFQEDRLRMFLYYSPVESSSQSTLQWYSTMVFLLSGQLIEIKSADNCSMVINVPAGDDAKAQLAKDILAKMLANSDAMCTKIPPPLVVTPVPGPIKPPGC